MNTPLGIALQRPLAERWAHDVAEFIASVWKQRRARRERDRRIDAMADLGEALLRDIGGPDDLLNRAAARRDANALRIEELRMLAGYRGGDSLFW